jgi:small subunit ribosomal protein S35
MIEFRKPFIPLKPTQVIQLRTQYYPGESHPADRKVVLSVPVFAIPFKDHPTNLEWTAEEMKTKFRKLAGPRWNAENDRVKIACEVMTFYLFFIAVT